MRLYLALVGFLVGVVGCSSGERTSALVGCGRGIDCSAVQAAVDNWYTASDGRISLSVVAGDDPDADVTVTVGDVGGLCAETFWHGGRPSKGDRSTEWKARIDVSPDALGDSVCGDLATNIAHELGHYESASNAHLADPAALMFAITHEGPVSATPADVAYALQ
jgi:hypothetical protein